MKDRTPVEMLAIEKSLARLNLSNRADAELPDDQVRVTTVRLIKPVAERLDAVTFGLGITKRRFLETAIQQALNEAERSMKEVGLTDEHV